VKDKPKNPLFPNTSANKKKKPEDKKNIQDKDNLNKSEGIVVSLN